LRSTTSLHQRVIKTAKQDSTASPSRLDRSDSPPTLSLPVSVFSSLEITSEGASPPRQQITLRFLDVDKDYEKFDMNTKFGTSFKIILASFKKKRNIFSYRSVRFNGVEIDENKSPNDLRMSSHDKIEVFGSITLASFGCSGGGNRGSNCVSV